MWMIDSLATRTYTIIQIKIQRTISKIASIESLLNKTLDNH